jgi:carboxyl-terminal processing protease
MPLPPAVPPFAGVDRVHAVVPRALDGLDEDDAATLARLPDQLATEGAALQRELGAPVVVDDAPPPGAAVWLLGPAAANPALAALGLGEADVPCHHLDRAARRLVTDAPDADGLVQAFSALRSLSRHPGGRLDVTHAHTVREAIERVIVDVHDTWAGFALRGVDWPALCARHVPKVLGATNPVAAIQRWLAELGDVHTWVRPARTQVVLPYGACVVDGEVVLTHVPVWTAGYAAGARPGWRLVGEDVRGTWATTPAAPSRPLLVARRLLSGDVGTVRRLEARGAGGWAHWEEAFEAPTGDAAVYERLPSGVAYLWIGAWFPGFGVEEAIDAAFDDLRPDDRLIVDLRGNGGGRLAMAQAFRDRFLDAEGPVGWIRQTLPGGRLGPFEPLLGAPSDDRRYAGRVRFLTSPLTYSSSEDALLGLQGRPNVQVVGEPSGGGSGRLRRLRLLPGWRLTISSALTYDLRGHVIEGNGIPVDLPVAPDRRRPSGADDLLAVAEAAPW